MKATIRKRRKDNVIQRYHVGKTKKTLKELKKNVCSLNAVECREYCRLKDISDKSKQKKYNKRYNLI